MRFTIYGPVLSNDGFGRVVIGLTQGLLLEGHQVFISPHTFNPQGVPEEVQACVGGPLHDSIGLWVASRPVVKNRHTHTVAYSMWEFEKLPEGWIPQFNQFDLNLVPCEWVKGVWASCGVTTPVEVIPLGFDPSLWRPLGRSPGRPWTFLTFGTLSARKAPLLALEAFLEAFPELAYQDVRLVLKSTPSLPLQVYSDDPRIEVINEEWSSEALVALCEECDCFVYPTRGEGFGLPPLEATATGMPVIMSDCTAGKDKLYPRYEIEMTGAETMLWGGRSYGYHPAPSYRGLIRQMRYVYENQAEARTLGIVASNWVHSTLTWRHCARRVTEVLRARFPKAA